MKNPRADTRRRECIQYKKRLGIFSGRFRLIALAPVPMHLLSPLKTGCDF
nr:MAG TPA: hypothetical protein [Caudoviricetes sp.]